MSVAPYPTIGWRGEPGPTHTGDPRVPRPCGWCWGARAVLERVDFGMEHEYLPVVCPGCGGRGSVRVDRRPT